MKHNVIGMDIAKSVFSYTPSILKAGKLSESNCGGDPSLLRAAPCVFGSNRSLWRGALVG